MKAVFIQFTPWDRYYAFDPNNLPVKVADSVVVTTEFGTEIGKVIEFNELTDAEIKELGGLKPLDRIATSEDLEIFKTNNEAKRKEEANSYCHKVIKRHDLEMKLVDCFFSFDDSRLTFAFIADGRVDFRNVVKELTKHFQKAIRLHQLGVRDEAKVRGDIGPCGQKLCCANYLKKLGNVTSELAETQQVAHRGSERLSGVCSRLKCCLAYEADVYGELSKNFPALSSRVKTNHGKGEVVGWHVLKGTVDVKIDPEKEGDKPMVVEVPIKK
ncbi:MAG: regulatory iron-sulfur-containing complex subunit RicT [Patescibacteria group bacterium]